MLNFVRTAVAWVVLVSYSTETENVLGYSLLMRPGVHYHHINPPVVSQSDRQTGLLGITMLLRSLR